MSGRMPVLREDDVAELLAKPVDDRHDLIAARYGERAVRTKIVLHVDDDQNVAVADCVSCGQFCLRSFLSCVFILMRRILVRHGLAQTLSRGGCGCRPARRARPDRRRSPPDNWPPAQAAAMAPASVRDRAWRARGCRPATAKLANAVRRASRSRAAVRRRSRPR